MRQCFEKSDIQNNRYWYALYTRPRFEKKIEKKLTDLNIECFLPLKTVTKYWSDRKKLLEEPLFPSYVFVYANSKQRYEALQPDGVVRMVTFSGGPARIPDEQIEAVRRILHSGYLPTVDNNLSKGDRVEIIAGPLIGLKGFVSEPRGHHYFSIFIDGICQSMSINIDAGCLKRIADN
ncbi:MAG: UpxY family transcription antiterminator [Aliifodinibius sp.]|nr:UpxY family transcription antiterminator [Fodinibius sp.]NIY27712.1 UpxY family transcription antiterminator [Fodinibius sp.]